MLSCDVNFSGGLLFGCHRFGLKDHCWPRFLASRSDTGHDTEFTNLCWRLSTVVHDTDFRGRYCSWHWLEVPLLFTILTWVAAVVHDTNLRYRCCTRYWHEVPLLFTILTWGTAVVHSTDLRYRSCSLHWLEVPLLFTTLTWGTAVVHDTDLSGRCCSRY